MVLKTPRASSLKNKTVIVRIDINSPVTKGKVQDNPRFAHATKTIKELLKHKAKIILLAHQGQKGKQDFLPLKQHATILSKHAHVHIPYIPDLFGIHAKNAINALKQRNVLLLENVRFYPDEKNIKTKRNRYKTLAQHADLFINDAFSVSHRNHGSLTCLPKYLPSYISENVSKELRALEKIRFINKKVLFILGGAKFSDYLPLFKKLKNKKTTLCASGILGNVFLVARGYDLGFEKKWLQRNNYLPTLSLLKEYNKKYASRIILPIDFAIKENRHRREKKIHELPLTKKILDIGEKTIESFMKHIKEADAVFMKGPSGFSEKKQFSKGTTALLKTIASQTKKKKLFSIIGGGHLTTTLNAYTLPKTFSHISLSGGALLQYIAGEKLPGLEAIRKNTRRIYLSK